MQPSVDSEDRAWRARLELDLERHGDATWVARRRHFGPLYLQKPFYPEGPDLPHLYLLHPPGGTVGGDHLEIRVALGARARALVTTPAAQKLYRSSGAESRQLVELCVAPEAVLEWLPAETIAFDGCSARQRVEVELALGAGFVGWEIGCFGRPEGARPFARGALRQELEIRREGRPLLVERQRVEGGSEVLGAAWGFANLPVFGTLCAVPASARDLAGVVELLRDELSSVERSAVGGRRVQDTAERCSVTALDDELLVVRAVAASVESLRQCFVRAWCRLRPELFGRDATIPRIWAT